jgi:hypothetical protein
VEAEMIFADVAAIRAALEALRQAEAVASTKVLAALASLDTRLVEANGYLKRIADAVAPIVVGIVVDPGEPQQRSRAMASVRLVKRAAARAAAPGAKAGPVVNFNLIDNEDLSFTVQGADAAGQPVDVSGVATLACVSNNTAAMTADAPAGMTVLTHALSPGSVTLTFTATWNDGSIGPFTIDFPLTISGGPATGLIVTPGTPVVRP